MERDLSRTSKRLSNKEVAQSVGFVATGIHEALNYLAIVKKVIEKTERIVSKRDVASGRGTDGSPEPRTNLYVGLRQLIALPTRDGLTMSTGSNSFTRVLESQRTL